MNYSGVAKYASGHGYNSLFYGNVVDMLNFTLIDTTLPHWVPIWGDKEFRFFEPVFNLADASISIGVISLLLFQKKFFRQHNPTENHPTMDENAVSNEEPQVL
jgi:signal peptidase II